MVVVNDAEELVVAWGMLIGLLGGSRQDSPSLPAIELVPLA